MSQPPSARRFAVRAAFLLLPLVAAAVAYPWVARWLGARGGDAAAGARAVAPEAPTSAQIEAAREAELASARAQQGWQKVETMAPREARRDASGELVAPFEGFGLSVESTPPGAGVRVDGRDVGETPLVASVACRPGDPVEVRVEKRPLRPQVRTVRCRADALLTVQVALPTAAPAPGPRPGP